jgi:hypothetical protein
VVLEVELFVCPYCQEEYTSHSDAFACASECVDIEDIDEMQAFDCEHCKQRYVRFEEAEECEESHTPTDPHIIRKSLESLATAASNPAQRRLS